MANLNVNTLDEEFITCQICLYEFDEENKKPKFLQCSHTICLECFQAARQQDTITCPFCRTCTSKDNTNGAEWILPTNRYVLEMIRVNRAQSNSVPPTALPVESEEEEYALMEAIEAMQQRLLNQEQVITTPADTAVLQPADEDEQLRLALEMSCRDMEQEALNEAMRQSLLNQQQSQPESSQPSLVSPSHPNRHRESQGNSVAAAGAIPQSTGPDSANDVPSDEIFLFLLLCSSVLYYAFLLVCQLIPFLWYRLHFALGIVFLLVNSAVYSSQVNLYIILFGLVLSYDIFFLFLELFMFFFYQLELLLVIVFLFFVCEILIFRGFCHHRTVPLSSTF
ncbi:E3 ubiquitin-protein ligase RNF168-like isoform X2 [Daphnia pulicaria]|uniref:E3 ubiquitin-protein ligase RNF168-like isoform X2 n=1 Tax=Daphnia pulicaria TaxID=35523 RepID=UPI001EEA07D3|nr:E3 ubiquitin-protein ligase RNF168-like isoform X2 [Daphnia pulicaria]